MEQDHASCLETESMSHDRWEDQHRWLAAEFRQFFAMRSATGPTLFIAFSAPEAVL
jgi:hypothetical protein